MKRTTIIASAAALMAITLIAACGKKYVPPTPVDPNTNPPFSGAPSFPTAGSQLNKLFKDLRTPTETICVTAGIPQTITFAKGTVLAFYPNSFKDATGKIITEGTICIEMTEMYKPGDMIANRTQTTAGKAILQSGGQVYIKATKSGQEVFANVYGIGFRQSGPSYVPMQLFYGSNANNDSMVDWAMADTTKPGTKADTGTTSAVIFSPTPPFPDPPLDVRYVFTGCTSFRFINTDTYRYKDPRTDVDVTVPDTSFNSKNTMVYLILPATNSVVGIYEYDLKRPAFDFSNYPTVPVGEPVSLVVISKKKDTWYYFEQTGLTVTEGMTIAATPEVKSLEFIKTRLGEL